MSKFLNINIEFEIGDTVYCKTDPEQKERIVIGFIVFKRDVLYRCVHCESTNDFYELELTGEKNTLKTLM